MTDFRFLISVFCFDGMADFGFLFRFSSLQEWQNFRFRALLSITIFYLPYLFPHLKSDSSSTDTLFICLIWFSAFPRPRSGRLWQSCFRAVRYCCAGWCFLTGRMLFGFMENGAARMPSRMWVNAVSPAISPHTDRLCPCGWRCGWRVKAFSARQDVSGLVKIADAVVAAIDSDKMYWIRSLVPTEIRTEQLAKYCRRSARQTEFPIASRCRLCRASPRSTSWRCVSSGWALAHSGYGVIISIMRTGPCTAARRISAHAGAEHVGSAKAQADAVMPTRVECVGRAVFPEPARVFVHSQIWLSVSLRTLPLHFLTIAIVRRMLVFRRHRIAVGKNSLRNSRCRLRRRLCSGFVFGGFYVPHIDAGPVGGGGGGFELVQIAFVARYSRARRRIRSHRSSAR